MKDLSEFSAFQEILGNCSRVMVLLNWIFLAEFDNEHNQQFPGLFYKRSSCKMTHKLGFMLPLRSTQTTADLPSLLAVCGMR